MSQQFKEYDKHRQKLRRDKNIQYIFEYLITHPCVDCGEINVICLDFHHILKNKKGNIGNMRSSCATIERLKNEIDKCIVLCSNCHRKRTAQENKWFKYTNQFNNNGDTDV